MENLYNLTLAQIVTSNHKAAGIFEKYHLDFCCKGKRSLEQACLEQHLPIDNITQELHSVFNQSSSNGADFEAMSLTQLSDYIVKTHHSFVKQELPKIHGYLQKVSSKHGERHKELYKILEIFSALEEEMESHMKKEEQVLFPRLKEFQNLIDNPQSKMQLNITYLQSPIKIMEQEHDHAGSMMNDIRVLSDNYTPPTDACTTYRLSFAALQSFELDLHQHVHLENNVLFPKALRIYKKSQVSVLN